MKINTNFIKTVIFGFLLTAPLNGLVSPEPQQKETSPVLAIPQKNDPFQDKVLGCILWSAVGDALGRITELSWMSGLGYNQRTINDFSDFRKGDYINGVAIYTDDTQMARIVLETLLENKNAQIEQVMEGIAGKFAKWVVDPDGGRSPHRAPGIGCINSSSYLRKKMFNPQTGKLRSTKEMSQINPRWWSHGEGGILKPLSEGGCGSVMRAYPFGVIYFDDIEIAAKFSAEHSLITHRAPIATASCAAMAVGVALALQGKSLEIITEKMIVFAKKYDAETATMMEKAVAEAKKKPTDVEVKKYLTSLEGKLAHQAISAAIYLLTCFPDDPFKTIQLAVNAYGDTDSMAAMAGALVGARSGAKSLFAQQNYKNWLEPLEDRENLINLGEQIAIEARS